MLALIMTGKGTHEQAYSNLEVAQPGLEVDHAQNAPEVIPDRDTNAPQVYNDSEKVPLTIRAIALGRAPIWITRALLIAITAILAVAIALGIGLRVGLKNVRGETLTKPTFTRSPQSQNAIDKAADKSNSSQPSQPSMSNTPTGSTQTLTSSHAVLNGTSLASLVRLDGERHVFFQDQSGIVREAIYQNDTGWDAAISYVVVTDARNNTPLGALSIPPSQEEDEEDLYLFYVNKIGHLAIQYIEFGQWVAASDVQLENGSFPTLSTSERSFSVFFSQPEISANYTVVIFYEDSDSNYNAVYGTSGPAYIQTWYDTGLSDVEMKGSTIRGPVAQCSDNKGGQALPYTAFAGALNGTDYVNLQLSIQNFGIPEGGPLGLYAIPGQIISQSFILSDLTCNSVYSPPDERSGIELVFWINGTELQLYNVPGSISMPSYSFPNLRLSAVSPGNSSQLFLYNQFNGSLISEHMFDMSTGHWTSSNISIEIE